MNQYSIQYYYLATGMEGHADERSYGTISAKSANDACMQTALKEYPNNESDRDFLIGCLTATLIKDNNIPKRERENMPKISTAARETLSERPEYNKQHLNQKQTKPVIKTCTVCEKDYNQSETNQSLTTLPAISGFDYDKQCLKCIKAASQEINALRQPDLKKAKQNLANITIAYQSIKKKYETLAEEYQALDYQASMINHYLTKPIKIAKASTTKKKQTSEKIKRATAMKILNNLTEEQQTAILTLIAKQ